MLKEQHPSVTELVWKWNRWHHEVDYTPFKKNQLKKKPKSEWPEQGNYNMKITEREH